MIAMIADCAVSVPRANPRSRRPWCSRREFFQRCARFSPACISLRIDVAAVATTDGGSDAVNRSEEHTSELQSLMRTSYAVFCFKNTTINYMHISYYTYSHLSPL